MNEKESLSQYAVGYCVERGRALIRVIICDDDSAFLASLKQTVESSLIAMGIPPKIHTYSALQEIGAPILASCDIAFLDIDLNDPSYNGFDVARRLRAVRNDAVIIFITNYIEYAPEGYEVQAFRYLLKKDYNEKLKEYIKEAIKQLEASRQTFKIMINGELIDLSFDSILYIESNLRTVTIHVQKGSIQKQYSCYATLSDLEKKLEPHGFLRIHKSYLVNMEHLKKYQCKEAQLSDGTLLRVSEKNYAEQKRKYLFWRGC